MPCPRPAVPPLPRGLLLALAASLTLTLAAPLHAQTAATAGPNKPRPAAAAPAAASRPPARGAKAKAPPPPPEIVLTEATQEQRAAAERTYFGTYLCEFNQSIRIERHPKTEGYVTVAWNKQLFTMKPVLSSTGALRLEDVTGRTLMIQIANKSMLLDTRIGQRLVDECISAEQRAANEKAKLADAPPPDSLGIDPVKTAAAKLLADVKAAAAAATAASAASAAASAPAPTVAPAAAASASK